jgi:ligand-binding sensor domain-containing protein/serine phosphatase RsbU (regulator of sigma subunit)
MNLIRITIVFSFCFTIQYLAAQPIHMKFEHMGVDQELPHNYVLSVAQDKHGFMWFGTANGLCRYDGYSCKVFNSDIEDSTSIVNPIVLSLVVDKHGTLWCATRKEGIIEEYDNENECFIHHTLEYKHPVEKIETDTSGHLWVILRNQALLGYNPENRNTVVYSANELTYQNRLLSNQIEDIECDRNNNIWVSTAKGLTILNPEKQRIKHYNDSIFLKTNSFKFARQVMINNKHVMWVKASLGPILEFDLEGKLQNHYNFFIDNKNYNDAPLDHIVQDSQGHIWFEIDRGLCRAITIKNNQLNAVLHSHNPDNPNSLSNNSIQNIFEDNKGILWIATMDKINKIDLFRKVFYHYSNQTPEGRKIKSNLVYGFHETGRGDIFIGTQKGVNIFKNNSVKDIDELYPSLPKEPTENEVWSFSEDQQGNIWFGGMSFLASYSPLNQQQNVYYADPGKTFDWGILWDLHIGQQNNLWMGSTSNGIYKLNLQTSQFQQIYSISTNCGEQKPQLVSCFFTDSKGHVWFEVYKQLIRYMPEKDTYENVSCKIKTIPDISLKCIYEDEQRLLWMGSEGQGLLCFDPVNEKVLQRYTRKDGLPDNTIWGILPDKHGNLWMSTNNGISELKLHDSVENPVFKNYDISDGLQGKSFKQGAYLKTSDDFMLFGGENGFNLFHPDSIEDNPFLPQIELTDLKMYAKPVVIGDTINGSIVLEKSIVETDTLVLTYRNNFFELDFAALHYSSPEKIQYAYKLEGKDTNWIYLGNEHKATFMNLPSGEYNFYVKATNNDGLWTEAVDLLHITQLPPWWQTWWFRAAVLVIILGIALGFYFYRINALKKQKKELESKVSERTAELKEANAELEERQEEILLQKEEIETSRNQLDRAFKNLKVLSDLGQKLTSTFDFEAINRMIYKYVSSLMDTSAFGIGIYNEQKQVIEFPYFMQEGKAKPYFYKTLTGDKSFTVKCFKNKEEIMLNDLTLEYELYLKELPDVRSSKIPSSMIYLPMIAEGKAIGTLTVNSFNKNAYDENDLANLRTLASYISIALDNSKAYRTIHRKNEQINGSMRYGQTIQNAILPSREQLDEYFDNFIIYRPKDIVSGDFYWFSLVETHDRLFPAETHGRLFPAETHGRASLQGKPMIFIAVVDCTGHGVPGAFMSMIGSRLLNDIIIERNIYSPAQILEQLNDMVRKALNQDAKENQDGMDVCLCRFEKQSEDNSWLLTFAGAKRPLIYYNSKSNKIETIDGTKKSIGGIFSQHSNLKFHEKTISLQAGDAFYLSTDGFADQCNPQKKKFSRKRIRELISIVKDNTMPEQGQQFEIALDEYRQGYAQRDDITLLGIRLKS